MEENKESGYEKYSEWFEIVEKMCNEETKVEDNNNSQGYYHYVLENGLHVYKNDKETFICEQETEDVHRQRHIERYGSMKITLSTGKNGYITYGEEGSIVAEGVGQGKDYAFLPSENNLRPMDNSENGTSQLQYETTGDLSSDMKGLLREALNRSENEETKNTYRDTIRLYEKFSNIILRDKLKSFSTNDLESILQSTIHENDIKKTALEEIKKQELIAKIIEAQKESQKLDEELEVARSSKVEER